MNDVEIIASIKRCLKVWALGDIYKALLLDPKNKIQKETVLNSEKAAVRGAFILACGLIDAMSCYFYAAESNGDNFRRFCEEEHYMPGYNAFGRVNDLYFSLRCGMLHNYQPKNIRGNTTTIFALTHNKPEMHLKQESNTVYINLQNFIEDVHNAVDKFFDRVEEAGTPERARTLNWAKEHGWFAEIPIIETEASISSDHERPMIAFCEMASSIRYDD